MKDRPSTEEPAGPPVSKDRPSVEEPVSKDRPSVEEPAGPPAGSFAEDRPVLRGRPVPSDRRVPPDREERKRTNRTKASYLSLYSSCSTRVSCFGVSSGKEYVAD